MSKPKGEKMVKAPKAKKEKVPKEPQVDRDIAFKDVPRNVR